MAVYVLKNAYFTLNGIDLSAFVRQITLQYSAEPLDDTAMSDNTRSRVGGLKDWSIEPEFYQDYAAGAVDATLFPLIGSSTVPFTLRPSTAIQGTTNPTFSGTVFVENYNPFSGEIGTISMSPTRLLAASDLARNTSST